MRILLIAMKEVYGWHVDFRYECVCIIEFIVVLEAHPSNTEFDLQGFAVGAHRHSASSDGHTLK